LAREVDDEGSGEHLFLNHPLVEGFAFAFCRCTNHRFGLTATMILLFEHPTIPLSQALIGNNPEHPDETAVSHSAAVCHSRLRCAANPD
jgi:hypothetical protein